MILLFPFPSAAADNIIQFSSAEIPYKRVPTIGRWLVRSIHSRVSTQFYDIIVIAYLEIKFIVFPSIARVRKQRSSIIYYYIKFALYSIGSYAYFHRDPY